MANRRWSAEEKRRIVERMQSCRHQDLADELGVDRRQLYAWRTQVRRAGQEPKQEVGQQRLERENRQLREALAKKVMEADFLRGALRRIEARRQASDGCGATASTKKSGK
ncbi:MAG TPA: transposase [Candidatus Angelobacter sp.]|nr:transposase [Candidatus Angelobacter sp.]